MRNKSLSLMIASIFAMVFVLGFLRATVAFTGVSGNTTTLEYSTSAQTVTISFQAQDVDSGADTDNLDNLLFTTVPVTLTSGPNNFNSASTIIGVITSLTDSTTSTQMSLTFTVPASQTLGNYLGTLTLSGDEPTGIPLTPVNFGIQIKIVDTTKPVITITGSSLEYVALGGQTIKPA